MAQASLRTGWQGCVCPGVCTPLDALSSGGKFGCERVSSPRRWNPRADFFSRGVHSDLFWTLSAPHGLVRGDPCGADTEASSRKGGGGVHPGLQLLQGEGHPELGSAPARDGWGASGSPFRGRRSGWGCERGAYARAGRRRTRKRPGQHRPRQSDRCPRRTAGLLPSLPGQNNSLAPGIQSALYKCDLIFPCTLLHP